MILIDMESYVIIGFQIDIMRLPVAHIRDLKLEVRARKGLRRSKVHK
jgi:hypothetical protein